MKHDLAKMISWILLALATIFLIWRIVGGSPTEFTIIITFLIAVTFNLVSVNNKISRLTGEFKEFKKNSENNFNSLARDFKEHIKHK
ncbi:hypothetical protein J4443_04340 [Candidatus Woesearchaeota archaeon]|nr:hypothetical protein [Candidatus Woesearchaeota archaeon]